MADTVLLISVLLGVGFVATRGAALLRLPHSVLLVLLGILGGVCARSIGMAPPDSLWAHFPDVVLYILLPPLIFDSAYQIEWQELRSDRWPLLALSVPALLFSCFAIGTGMHFGLGFKWQSALLFGALISATDPVAVVALFRQLGARQRLTLLVEGESLLNDGTAIVLFRVLLASVGSAAAFDLPHSILSFFLISLGGVLVGLALIVVFRVMFAFTAESSGPAQLGLTVTAAYVSFIVADHWLGVSGVLSTLTVGLYLGSRARVTLNREALHGMQGLWDFFALSANTMVFLAVGLSFDLPALQGAAALIPAMLLTVYLTRAISVFGSLLITNRLRLSEPISWGQQAVIAWGGLRGGLALALVLILPDSFADKRQFLTLATALVLVTLIFNGLTMNWLLRRLRLNVLSGDERVLLSRSLALAFDRVFAALEQSSRLGGLSTQLLEEVRNRWCGPLELLEAPDMAPFATRQLLANEQSEYNRQYEIGVLSTAGYLHLSRSIRERLEILESDTPAALTSYRFSVASPRYLTDSLELKLEILLHLCRGLEAEACEPRVAQLRQNWLDSAVQQLDEFQRSHPGICMSVQESYVARVLATTARHALEDLRDSQLINPTIYAQAMIDVGVLHDELIADSQRLLQSTFRELLGRIPLFCDLPDESLARIEAGSQRRLLTPGQIVFAEGAEGNSFFVVLSGILELRQSRDEPDKVKRMFAGSFFGELSLLFGVKRTATVSAVISTELIEIAHDLFEQTMESSPKFQRNVRERAIKRAARSGLPLPPEFA